MQSTCEHCGKSFSHAKAKRGRFCSRACKSNHGKQEKQCPTCGKTFKTFRSEPNARTYCSATCYPPRVEKIHKTCEGCGKDFLVYPSQNMRKFCSEQCRASIKSVIKNCEHCGKEFHSFTKAGRKHCSRECLTAAKRVYTTCPVCGKEFWYHRTWPRVHCSQKCSNSVNAIKNLGAYVAYGKDHPFWEGGSIDYRGPSWPKQRDLVRNRDKHKCQHCGITEKKLGHALHVHHIKPFRTFGYVYGENDNDILANDLCNLVSLCPSCHKRAEFGRIPIQPTLLSVP